MTRYKKELRNKGFLLEIDYPYYPYNTLQGIRTYVDTDGLVIKEYYAFGTLIRNIGRNMIEASQHFD